MDYTNNDYDKDRSNNVDSDTDKDAPSYGAVYTPDPNGNGYLCERYNTDDSEYEKDCVNNTVSQKHDEKRKRNHISLGLVAILVSLCLVISSVVVCGTMLVVGDYFDYSENVNTPMFQSSNNSMIPENNVYFDITREYTEETVVAGSALSMEEAIMLVKDSVVEITTESLRSGLGGFSQYVVGGAGSGVIISSGGYIVTNNHVVEGANNIIVRLTDGSQYKAKIVGTDSKSDIAVISIDPPEGVTLTSAVIGDSDLLKLGQTVISIGNPLGELGGTVTDGIISCLAREIAIDGSGTMTLLQTNVAVSPGNSGGGLFDLYGRLIGIVNAKFSGEGVEGISFAIPMNTAWAVAKQLIDKGYVSGRPALGVTLSQVQYGYGIFGGTSYQVVIADPQNVDELKANDIIVGINNIQVSTIGEVSDIVSSCKIGDVLTLTVVRERKYLEIKVTLVEYSPVGNDKNTESYQ